MSNLSHTDEKLDWEHGESNHEPALKDIPLTIQNLPRIPMLALIRLYQVTVSRALPSNTCRFYPSCSHYGYQAVYKYGAIKGSIMAIWRIIRCNPFNPGGFDPVN
jgi:putative membrane protein insertion efficiency factor